MLYPFIYAINNSMVHKMRVSSGIGRELDRETERCMCSVLCVHVV